MRSGRVKLYNDCLIPKEDFFLCIVGFFFEVWSLSFNTIELRLIFDLFSALERRENEVVRMGNSFLYSDCLDASFLD